MIAVAVYLIAFGGSPFESGTWVDLSYSFDEHTIYWPTASPFVHETEFDGHTENGFYYSAFRYSASEHGGTHLDAPIHFAEGQKSADQIPIERLSGPVCVVDVSAKALEDRDYLVSREDLVGWETQFGQIPEGALVFLRTGYGRYWPDRKAYLGTDLTGPEAVPHLHFPGLDPAAAQWLVKKRMVFAVGLDTPSIDRGQSTLFEAHQVLAKHNIAVLENLAQLEQLPPTGAWAIALPMKIAGGSGGPARVVAWVPKP